MRVTVGSAKEMEILQLIKRLFNFFNGWIKFWDHYRLFWDERGKCWERFCGRCERVAGLFNSLGLCALWI